MIGRYRDGVVPDVDVDATLAPDFDGLVEEVCELLDRAEITQALERIWQRVRRLNRYVEERAPWQLAKEPDAARRSSTPRCARSPRGIRAVTVLLHPYMPETAAKLLAALGDEELALESAGFGDRRRRRDGRRRCRSSSRSRSDRQPHAPRQHAGHRRGDRRRCAARPASRGSSRSAPTPRARARRRPPPRRTRTSGSRSAITPTTRPATPARTPTSCVRSRATRAAPRSARPGSTTSATTRRGPTRSARSPRTSASRASSASRW